MKHNKIIYLIAFLLSLSIILLLEASSLGLLAEDIKPKEKEKVEIELLLSASNTLSEANAQLKKAERTEKIQKEPKENQVENNNDQKTTETEINTEVDKNSSEEEKKEIEATNNKLVEKERVNEPQKNDNQNQNEIAEKEDGPPAWLQQAESKNKEDLSTSEKKEDTTENKSDKFDLESYLAELEKEDEINNKTANKQKSVNNNLDQSQNNGSEKSASTKNIRKNNNEEITENDKTNNFTADESNQQIKENKVYDLRTGKAEEIKKPGIKNYSQPDYPSHLRKRNIEGKVIVSLRIDKKGQVHNIKINQSSGYDSFDQAALDAVSNWDFKAAEKYGEKVEVIINIPIRFELN